MSILRKKDDVILDVTSNVVNGDVVVGEVIKVDGQHYTVDSISTTGLGSHDVFGDGSAVATYEMNGDATDLGGTYDGTPSNVTYAAGTYGDAGVFNGSNSKVTLAIPAPAGGVGAVSFWGARADTADSVWIGSANYLFRVNGVATVYVYGASSFRTFSGGSNFTTDVMRHVVVMYDGSDARVFIDNVEQSVTGGSATGGMTSITRLGEKDNGTLNLNGRVDHVRVFNRELTLGEIADLYEEHLMTPDVLTTTPTLPGTITNASTEYKTKLTVTDNIPDTSQLFIGDDILIDGIDYSITDVTQEVDKTSTLDFFGDGSCFAAYTLDVDGTDLSGNHDGTEIGTVLHPAGKYGNAANFGGSVANYINIPDHNAFSPALGPVSISFWYYPTDLASRGKMINKVETANAEYFIETAGGANLRIYVTQGSGSAHLVYLSGNVLTLNQWHHIVGTIENGVKAELFLDKVSLGSDTTPVGSMSNTTSPVKIGAPLHAASGYIDQVRFFNKIITQGEIDALYADEVHIASLITTPTLPGTVTDAYVKHMTAIGGQKEPSTSVDELVQIYTVSDLPDIMSSSDGTNITVNVRVANGDLVYTQDGTTSIDSVTVASVVDNANGTWTFAHGQSYTPSECYSGESVAIEFSTDAWDNVVTPTKGAPAIVESYTTGTADVFGDNSIIATYTLEVDGTDLAGNHSGTVNGSPDFLTGKFGNAPKFTADTEYIQVTNHADLSIATDKAVSFWVYVDSYQPSDCHIAGIWGESGQSAEEWVVSFSSGGSISGAIGRASAYSTHKFISTGVIIGTGAWVHIVFNMSPYTGRAEVFKNKVPIGFSTSGAGTVMGTGTSDFRIGRSNQSTANYGLLGQVDQFRYFNRLLTQNEIDTLFTELGPSTIRENYNDIVLGASAPLIDHKVKVIDQLTDVNSVQTKFKVEATTSLDIFGDGSCFAAYTLDADGTDLSGNHDGTVNGSPSFVAGKYGNAVEFTNTTTKYISIPDNDAFSMANGDLTISLWVYVTGVTSRSAPVAKIMTSQSDWSVEITTSRTVVFTAYNAAGGLYSWFTSAATVPLNGWAHVVMILEGGQPVEGFIDKVSVGTGGAASGTLANSTALTTIGKRQDNNYPMEGLVDQVRFFNRVLTQGEIDQLFLEQKIL